MKIAIIGQGKLGACMSAAFASRGFEVLAIDINEDTVAAISAGRSPDFVQEPYLDEMLREHGERITATTDFAGIADCEASFIIVPTPTPDEDQAAAEGVEPGAFSLKYVMAALGELGAAVRDREYHLVTLTSTVLLGDCEERLVPLLEDASGLRVGDNLGFCYSPEFIALGQVIRDLLDPEFVLIGECDERAGDILEGIYRKLFGAECRTCSVCSDTAPPFHRMSIKNAELAKVSLNRYVTTKITFANETAALCERFVGGDCDAVLDALGADTRIGARFFRGALGFGGPCFPRDSRAMAVTMRRLMVDPAFPLLIDRINDAVYARIVDTIDTGDYETVSVLGLAYKPHTPVTEESQAVKIAAELAARGYGVYMWDEFARVDIDGVEQIDDMQECANTAELVLLTLPLPGFYRLSFAPGQTVYDCWRVLRGQDLGEGVEYVGLGLGRVDDIGRNDAR